MPSPVYSTLFVHASIDSSATSAAANYTVPAGKVAVIRSIDIVTLTAGLIYVGRNIAGVNAWLETSYGLAAPQARHWDGDQVVNAGQLIRTLWASGNHSVSVSGFLLTASS